MYNEFGLAEEEVRRGVKLRKYLPNKVARLQLQAPTNSWPAFVVYLVRAKPNQMRNFSSDPAYNVPTAGA
jgi:hypothetical protein